MSVLLQHSTIGGRLHGNPGKTLLLACFIQENNGFSPDVGIGSLSEGLSRTATPENNVFQSRSSGLGV